MILTFIFEQDVESQLFISLKLFGILYFTERRLNGFQENA